MDGASPDDRPGRICPLAYRHSPAVFDRPPEITSDTLYVIGGLYGNTAALDALLELVARESHSPALVFNGDFNWFNVDPANFARINTAVLQYTALRGNVETELAGDAESAGCGCAYPDQVADAEVERSNEIERRLRATARLDPLLRQRLGALPMHAVARVGNARIGMVHGDAESLAGWRFAHDQLDTASNRDWLMAAFAQAKVDVFASTHTCLPALRRWDFGTVINNGAAGMPNIRNTLCGLVTRIALTKAPIEPLYGTRLGALHVDALPLHYDQQRWLAEFLHQWPEGSPAHQSYFRRICQGPEFALESAQGTR